MTEEEAELYHSQQISVLAETNADMLASLTLNYAEEAIGVVRAAVKYGLPVVISFTVEIDGKLPSGQTLKEAIEQVDNSTNSVVAYFMINCANPLHFT